ncbi:MAG: amidohydrolase [Bacteroidota bacterium]
MEDLNVALIQSTISWQDKEASIRHYENLLVPGANLYVFPEMFNTGFSMETDLAEDMNGPSVKWLKEKATEFNAAMCASLIIEDDGFKNRMLFVFPEGNLDYYDKRHLFSMAGEHEHFQSGTNKKIVTFRGWNILLQVCYDLRFPVFSRNQFIQNQWEYDLAIYIANWPSPRSNAWRNLIEARAHENQCYVAAVNRVGKDGNNLNYLGDSALINPKGHSLLHFNQGEEGCEFGSLSAKEMIEFREKFPVGRDADFFTLQ